MIQYIEGFGHGGVTTLAVSDWGRDDMRSSVRLECKLVMRDRGTIATACLLSAILLLSLVSGLRADQAETMALRSAAQKVQAEWNAQPPKNPHSAAHYGILVYRPRAPLQAIEPGVLPYLGAVTFLEAHKRNSPILSPASVRDADSRYGGTRFSPMLQISGGFLALVLGFLIGAREQRRGMAPLLRGTGVRGAKLVAAKTIVTASLIALAAMPALLLAAAAVGGGDAGARFAALAAGSLVHLLVLASLGVAAGVWLGAARFGLAAVAFTWALGVMILPRIVDIAAERIAPLTDRALAERVEADFKVGPDGHSASDANKLVEQQTLARYGVTRKEDLPVNFDALLMQADEEYRGGVYDRRLTEADAVRQLQDTLRRVAWAFGPTPAMLDLSTRLSGADAETQRRFDVDAEAFRRTLVGRLNRHMAENSKTGDWEWTTEDRYFASFAAFKPPSPTLVDDAPGIWPSALVLLGWLGLAAVALAFAARRFDRNVRA